jgi:hypothetical protein
MSKERNYELEYLRMQNESLQKKLEEKPSISDIELIQLVNIASEMRELLIQCRNQQIDYRLAKKIDDVLRNASELD